MATPDAAVVVSKVEHMPSRPNDSEKWVGSQPGKW